MSPGEILETLFMRPMGITRTALAKHLEVSPDLISKIILGKRDLTIMMSAKLSRAFTTPENFWIDLQRQWDQPALKHIKPLKEKGPPRHARAKHQR